MEQELTNSSQSLDTKLTFIVDTITTSPSFLSLSPVPHIKYTPPASPTTLPSAPPPIVSTVTTVVSLSPDSVPHQGLLEAINDLRADFNTYKHEQESVIHHLKMLVEDSFAESADEVRHKAHTRTSTCIYE